ncbi:substrate-binding domain-containing protein [Verrucomicrobiaceae bacterium N1E253]|uniref:Substrate-binding domain-containing protein n=1 Tax=Oceaniferula marina TaxID=2748318 RepID=A0A851GKX1_9BACT|nr:substrate-binding domain-containing protein [Oceaniferula marina]NWK55737.1 substrate-binding domain-containing protein [Oceaniferula marina]
MKTPQKISLVTQTANILRDQIATGKILHMLPGENKMSEDLQVSRKTLRAALLILTSEEIISEPTPGARRRILSKPQKVNQQRSVGILLPRPLDELHASSQDLFRALRKNLNRLGVSIHYHDYPFLTTRQNPNQIKGIFKSHHADVWVVLEITTTIVEIAEELNIPVVACGGRTHNKFHNVAYDAVSALEHAFHNLINHGHQRICYPSDKQGSSIPSLASILEQQGIEVIPELHFPACDQSTTDFVCMLERLFKRPNPPTAFITGGPRNLITLITWLAKQKLCVPEDVSILHIGSDPMISPIIPKISYYSTSYAPLAKQLGRIISALLENPNAKLEQKTFFMDYIPGASLAPPQSQP